MKFLLSSLFLSLFISGILMAQKIEKSTSSSQKEKINLYAVNSFAQDDNDLKTGSFFHIQWQGEELTHRTYSSMDEQEEVTQYEILERGSFADSYRMVLAQIEESQRMDAEIKGNMYLAFLYRPSEFSPDFLESYELSFFDRSEFDALVAKDKEDLQENLEEILDEMGAYARILVKKEFMDQTFAKPSLDDKVATEDFIALLELIKSKIMDFEEDKRSSLLNSDGFMLSALAEANFNSFNSKYGFKDAMNKLSSNDKVKVLLDEIKAIAMGQR